MIVDFHGATAATAKPITACTTAGSIAQSSPIALENSPVSTDAGTRASNAKLVRLR